MSLEDRLYPLLGLYERLPLGVKRAAGFVYRQLPRNWRWGARFAEFEHLAMEGESWDPDAIREYQLKQLRLVLHHAANHCPFYQQHFIRAGFRPENVRSTEDLKDCPLLEKRMVQDHLDRLASSAIPAGQRLYITTGGSTGVPVGFFLQRGVSRPKEQAFLEGMWRRAGYAAGARLAVIRGHVTTARAEGRIATCDPTRDWLLLSSSHLVDARLPEYLSEIERFRPDFLHAYPSAALQIAEYLARMGQSWRTPLRGLLCGSEQLTMGQKRMLEQVFQCRVYRWYGHSERVVLAGEGARSELFHFWPQYGLVEFGPPDEDGLCEVIGTSFHNLAMPLIRYRTGDRVRLADPRSEVAPEFPWPVAVEIAGRAQEYLISATGRKISLTTINMHDAIFDGLYSVQFYQETPGRAEFRYVGGPEFHRSRLTALEAGLKRKLGDDFALELREVRETEKTVRGKHRWLISRLGAQDGKHAAEGKTNPTGHSRPA